MTNIFKKIWNWFMTDDEDDEILVSQEDDLSNLPPPRGSKIQKDRPKMPETCDKCNKVLNPLNSFFCKYCERWHCNKHKLPEDHSCKATNPHKQETAISIQYQ